MAEYRIRIHDQQGDWLLEQTTATTEMELAKVYERSTDLLLRYEQAKSSVVLPSAVLGSLVEFVPGETTVAGQSAA